MVNTLSKFGVPLDGGGGRGGILQPKMRNRFRVRFINFGPLQGGLELTQQVVNVNKPRVAHEEVQIDSYNSRAWVAGKHTWEPITIMLRDDITNSISRLVGHQQQKQLDHFEQTAFASGVNYKFTTYIDTLDGGNDVTLESWFLEGCFLQNTSFEDLDYATSEVQNISLTVRYDNATLGDGLFPTNPAFIQGSTVG